MKPPRLILFILFLCAACSGSAQSWQWAREDVPSVFGVGDPEGDHSAATDPFGNVYITGQFADTLSFGAFTLRATTGDTYLVKYNSQGQVIWARQSISSLTGSAVAMGVACDRSGNVYITGGISDTTSFGAFTLISPLSAFLVKYDPNGNVLWARSAQTGGYNSSASGFGVVADDFGNCYIAGDMSDSVSFGTFTLTSSNFSMFLVKYDSNGNVLWAKENGLRGSASTAYAASVALDPSGDPFVTGTFSDTVSFGTNTLIDPHIGSSYLVKYDPAGNVFWARKITGTTLAAVVDAMSVSVDSRGNAYLTGNFRDTVSFGSINLVASGIANLFLAKYNAAGQVIWAKMDRKPADGTTWRGLSVVCDTLARGGGYLMASGYGNGLTDTFIFGSDTFRINSGFWTGDVLFSFDSLGVLRCGSILSEGDEDDGSSVAVDRSGQYIYITGDIANPVTLGNDNLPYGADQPFIAQWMNCSVTPLSSAIQSVNVACKGSCTGMASANPSGGVPPYTYSWSPSGGNSDTAIALCAGTYTCLIHDARDSILMTNVTITEPFALLTVTGGGGGSIHAGQDTLLRAIVNGGTPAYSYFWNGVPGGDTLRVSPMSTTTYTVTVTDSRGCSVTETILITTESCGSLFVPNAFSPNEDGQNDKECIRGLECISNLDFSIYDRWGERVFETTDPNRCWDGTYKGRAMEPAVFVYYLKGTLLNGQAFEKKGNISLVR